MVMYGCEYRSVPSFIGQTMRGSSRQNKVGKTNHGRQWGGLKALMVIGVVAMAVGVVGASQAAASMITFVVKGTYLGPSGPRDGLFFEEGTTATQTYTLDTVTKTGSAEEIITSGSNTYQIEANNVYVELLLTNTFIVRGGTSPHTVFFAIGGVRGAAPELQDDLSNLADYFTAFNANGAGSASMWVTDQATQFRVDSAVAPEPASALIAMAGLLIVAGRRTRRIG